MDIWIDHDAGPDSLEMTQFATGQCMLKLLAMCAVSVAVCVFATGCSASQDVPRSHPSASHETTPPSAATAVPQLANPNLTATEVMPLFQKSIQQIWSGSNRLDVEEYIRALEETQFDRLDMTFTSDHTTIGRTADSFDVAVLWGTNSCLIAQIGPTLAAPVTAISLPTETGACLVGQVRRAGTRLGS